MMSRKTFVLATASTALVALMGLHTAALADALKYTYTASWAGYNTNSVLLFSVRAQQDPGSEVTGSCGVSGSNWTCIGVPSRISNYTDADGMHSDVVANVTFNHLAGSVKTDAIAAVATFHMLKKANGSSFESVDIVAANGTPLYMCGKDAAGKPNYLPLMKGSISILGASTAPQASPQAQ